MPHDKKALASIDALVEKEVIPEVSEDLSSTEGRLCFSAGAFRFSHPILHCWSPSTACPSRRIRVWGFW